MNFEVLPQSGNQITVRVSAFNLRQFAESWPCFGHVPASRQLFATFNSGGDLVDCYGGDGLDAAGVSAMLDDCLASKPSTPNRIVIDTAFHHMNDGGYYDGWSEHSVIITPSLVWGYEIRVTGRNRNDIKDYIAETFQHALSRALVVTFDTDKVEYGVTGV